MNQIPLAIHLAKKDNSNQALGEWLKYPGYNAEKQKCDLISLDDTSVVGYTYSGNAQFKCEDDECYGKD